MLKIDDDKLISEFNEAKFQIARLHNLWMEARNYREKGNLVALRWALDSATIELHSDAERLDSDSSKNKYIEELNEIDLHISEAILEKNMSNLYHLLVEKEKLLRNIQESAGKGAKLKPSDEDGM